MNRQFLLGIFLLMLGSCGPTSQENVANQVEIPIQNQVDNSCSGGIGLVQSIATLIEQINALSKPVSLQCFLTSLQHPLRIQATSSVISVQSATSRERPRVFIESGGLYMSLVPGENQLEIGETWQQKYSIKGELIFPIVEDLADNAPFVNVSPLFVQQNRCGSPCHGATQELSKIGGVSVFASQIIRPNPADNVTLDELKQAWKSCQPATDQACKVLEALFEVEEPDAFDFAEDMPYY